jgi:hypothetical protein
VVVAVVMLVVVAAAVVLVVVQNLITVVCLRPKNTKRYKIHKNNLVTNNNAYYISLQRTGTVFSGKKSQMSA